MTTPLEIESDPLFKLLTDALRAGPGSPQWHQALGELRQSGQGGSDEYQMLLAARERLESGKQFRAIRAGPGFTRRLMSGLDQQSPAGRKPPGFPIALIVLTVCLIVLVTIIGTIVHMSHSRPPAPATETVADLTGANYLSSAASVTFDKSIPSDWPTMGGLALRADKGLKPGGSQAGGGGVYWSQALTGAQAFELEAEVAASGESSQIAAEVFVSDSRNFNDKGAASKEVVWMLLGSQQQVRVNGAQAATADALAHFPASMSVQIIVGHTLAAVKVNGQVLWSGPHGLGDAARFVGVRFIRITGAGTGPLAVTSVRVLRK